MNKDLLNIIGHLEREKGIDREKLITMIEGAILTASKKSALLKGDVVVKIDRETGEMRVFLDDKEVTPANFGRIAAQTAKQVIIQKIREAEREVIFEEFSQRTNELMSGIIQRYDRGNIIINIGKAETILPKKEQVPRDDYRQGERVRVIVTEARKTNHGPEIIVSRRSPIFIKKLFELEVPEISEGIVSIESIARDAGERTKIAVSSASERIDAVGACVGMKGIRVKNIVGELRGEKIDIVRYNDDPVTYVKNALSPAEIRDVKLDRENKTCDIIVNKDQLSLAIGRHGQNTKLAAKLTGWKIDVKCWEDMGGEKAFLPLTKAEIAEDIMSKKIKEIQAKIQSLPGVGPKVAEAIVTAGFTSIEQIAQSEVNDLSEIPGIGGKMAEKIIASSREYTGGE